MPKYTNENNLPDPICRAIDWAMGRHKVAEGAYVSATGACGSPLVRWLYKRHKDDIVIDYSRLGWCLDGILAHELFGRFGAAALAEGETFYEEPSYFEIPIEEVGIVSPDLAIGAYRVSFTPDLVKSGRKLLDYKRTSVYKIREIRRTGQYAQDWERQLNIYRYGLHCGFFGSNNQPINLQDVDGLSNVVWMRDWGPRFKDISDSAFATLDCPVWSYQKTHETVVAGLQRLALSDMMESPPEFCQDEDRWYDGRKVAGFVPGRKCKGYCDVSDFCPYMRKWLSNREDTGGESNEDQQA